MFELSTNFSQNCHQIQSQNVKFSKFPRGACPQTPLESSCFAFRRVCFTHCEVTSTCVPPLANPGSAPVLKVCEEEEKRKLNQFVKSNISGMLEAILLKFGMWSTEVGGGVSTAKIILFHKGSTELRRCENHIFFLPVNIFTVLRADFLATLHTTDSIDDYYV